ncbi:sulfotransferase domain-containing protein [Micromonospora sp. NPDC006766]|uniref:sulfotransferase domain-containing protein n=1 Tax=Micromonospora sp. NPDC006766 TaxID=3154778 RepID=UPI0034066D04
MIISNGRCGSTLLSDLIGEEPETLSAHEFFMGAMPWTASEEITSGAAYWAMLSSPKPDLRTLFRVGLPLKELAYPADGRRAGDLTELPWILAITLPKLTPDPDALFDELAVRVPRFPAQPVMRHHRMVLDLLTRMLGRRRWVERSGGSTYLAPQLLTSFPDARVVYLTRNWEDTARSMARHPSFQLIQLRVEFLGRCGVDPFLIRPDQAVPEDLERFLPERIDAAALTERGQDLRRYLWLCAFLTSQAEQALADTPPEHLLTMSYEDLVADPETQLGRLGRFLDFADWPGWAARVAGHVVAQPSRRQPVTT